jgi:glycerol-1-phosphate dehydrogenase [NAD(P)+]
VNPSKKKNAPVSKVRREILSSPATPTRPCACGKSHPITTRELVTGTGALSALPSVISACGLSGVALVVYDRNTFRLAGKHVGALVAGKNFLFPDRGPVPCDSASLGRLEKAMAPGIGYIVAVGSGTLNDLVKVAASSRKIPYLVIATAPSMDGYLSANAAILVDGVKTAFTGLAPAVAAIADTRLFRTAPQRMVRAGVGDALGKYVANAEWKMGEMLGLETFCPEIWKRVRRELDALLDASDRGAGASDAFLEALMRTLMVTGIAMQMSGNSLPASGAEHHVSHVMEMRGYAMKGHAPSLHGLQVAFGTWWALGFYERLLRLLGENRPLQIPTAIYESHRKDWKDLGVDLDAAISKKLSLLARLPATTRLLARQVKPAALRPFFTDRKRLDSLYRRFSLPKTPRATGLSMEGARFALTHAVDLRPRITVIDLMFAAGQMDEALKPLKNRS